MEKAIGWSAAGRCARAGDIWRAVYALCVLAMAGLCLALVPVALASPPAFTWNGGAETSAYWSNAGNWEGDVAPTVAIGALRFPRLASEACIGEEQEFHACYFSTNNLGGLSAESMQIDDGDEYFVEGRKLTLGAGGLSASPASGSSGPAGDFIFMPFQLSASQKWSVADRPDGKIEENGLFLVGEVTGSGSALAVELSNGAALILDNDAEVGPLTLEGPNATGEHIANGTVLFGDGELNASNRQPVDLRHIYFAGTGAVGPLTTDGATLDVGSDSDPAEGLDVTSVKLDSATGVLFEVMGSGTTPQTDYSQLVSEGPVELAGSLVVLVGKPSEEASCPTLVPGVTYTFVSTTGKLSGTFANAPEGGPEIPISFASSCGSKPSQTMRVSYNRSGGTETVTGTVEEEAVNKKHHEESVLKLTQEEAAAKEKQEQEAAAAAAKKRQEEETAKAGVLGTKEGSPDATIASTFLQAGASGTVSLKVSCPMGVSSCMGTVTLRTLDAVRVSAVSSATMRRAILTLATGTFTVPGGGVRTVTLHLSAKARALLARSHLLHVQVTIVAHDPAGGTHSGRTIATLRAPRAKHGKG